MPGHYPGTQVPFVEMDLDEIRAQITGGAGHVAVSDAGYAYRTLSALLQDTAAGLRAVATELAGAHEGAAADATRRHLERLATATEAGEAQAQRAVTALLDQAGYVADVRTALNGVATPEPPSGLQTAVTAAIPVAGPVVAGAAYLKYLFDKSAAQEAAAAAAETYQVNNNANYQGSYQPFDPPPAAAVDAGAGPATAVPDWGGGGGATGVAPAGTAPAAATGTAPPASGVAGGMAVSGAAPAATTAVPTAGAAAAGAPPVGAGTPDTAVRPGAAGAGGPAATSAAPAARPAGAALPARPVAAGSPSGPPASSGPVPPSAAGAVRGPGGLGGAATAAPLTGWKPGQPWSSRSGGPAGSLAGRHEGGAAGGATGRGPGAGSGAGAPAPREPFGAGARPAPVDAPHTAAGAQSARAGYGMPMMAGAGGLGRQDDSHDRPPWLLEDDPDAVWFAGVAQFTDPVIGGESAR